MKKIVIFLLLNMFTVCNVYKCNDTDNISKEESEKASETIHQPDTILIEFDGGIHILWDNINDRIIKDENYYIATQKPININIVNAISDTTFVSESVCSKHSSLKKGDIAFILLFYSFEFLDYMDFGMYFDCLTDTCLYFNGQLDWLEHNRGYIKERILKKYFNSGNTHH